jgi:multidrug efflux pump subunit AcrA (membrane-fusion protein)
LRGEEFSGDVVAIVPQADYQSRTFPVRVRVENRMSPHTNAMMLKPGMFARVELPVLTVSGALMIPKDALVLDRTPPTVWVVTSPDEARNGIGSSVRPVSVEIDEEVAVGNWVQVVGPVGTDGSLPLKAGELVITEGNERVNPRAHVIVTSRPATE